MAGVALWLGLSLVIISVGCLVFIILLAVGAFNLPPNPPPVLDPPVVGPWSGFTADIGASCKIYPGNTIPYYGFNITGTVGKCTPLNQVASIKTVRTCLSSGCIDVTGQAQPIEYVETVWQDCDQNNKGTACNPLFQPCPIIPACKYLGYDLVQLYTGNCYSQTGSNIIAIACDGQNPNQQFNVLKLSDNTYPVYQFATLRADNCLIGTTNTTVEQLGLGVCNNKNGWLLTPEKMVPLTYNTTNGTISSVMVKVPSQLIYLPDIKVKIPPLPDTYDAILATYTANYKSLQRNLLLPFIAGCTSQVLPPGAPNLVTCGTIGVSLTPTALL